jgi:DNA invertase Pin-like site-specific DNA recombinase
MAQYVIYARKSTESEDRQVLSIPAQIDELKALAARRGIVVARVIDESRSAKEPGRPHFGELVRDISAGKIGGVLCWKLDRLARNPIDGAAIMWALSKKTLGEVVTPSRTFNGSSDDVLLMSIEFGMAKKYVDDLSDNVIRGLKARAARGWLPNRPPLGYLSDRNSHTIVIDPVRFPLLRRAMEYVIRGTRPSEVLDILNRVWGYRNPTHVEGAEGAPMPRSTFYRILGDPFYSGLFRFRGELYKGLHPIMVSPEETDTIQRVLKREGRPRSAHHEWSYTGLIRCGACGGMITASWQRGRLGKLYPYYYCPRRNGCGQPYASLEDLEAQLSHWFDRISLPNEVVAWYVDLLDVKARKRREENETLARSRQKAKESLERQLGTLTDLRIRNVVRDEEYLEQRERLLQQQVTLENPNRDFEVFEPAKAAVLALNQATKRFAAASVHEKRLLVEAVCSNPRLIDKKLLIQAKKPFDLVREGAGSLTRLGELDDLRTHLETKVDRLLRYFQRNDEEIPVVASRVLRLVEAVKGDSEVGSNVVSRAS